MMSIYYKIYRCLIPFSIIIIFSCLIIVFFITYLSTQSALAQTTSTIQDYVKYSKQSNYIKEFKVPISELGLKGITTDNQNNVWFYHSTNISSSIFRFNQTSDEFTQFNITSDTVVDTFVTNLAGGQLVFDDNRNYIWFTDARTNSIGKLDIESEVIQLYKIPTESSGPLGITLSPDKKNIWFTEILGNKLGTFVIDEYINENTSNDNSEIIYKIIEFPIYQSKQSNPQESNDINGGPTLLTFDDNGILWITMSYSHNILRVEPWILLSGNTHNAFNSYTLPDNDTFSPFGIASIKNRIHNMTDVTIDNNKTDDDDDNNYNKTNSINHINNNTNNRFFISDHGSSRVILTLGDSYIDPFEDYLSFWTSPSPAFPSSLPSQIVVDKNGENVYFAQHGGNKISKIDLDSGIMTEYEIPTGPLSTTVFIALSMDDKRLWFTEYASNKIAYLNTAVPIPYQIQIFTNDTNGKKYNNTKYPFFKNLPKTFDVILNIKNDSGSRKQNNIDHFLPVHLNNIELSVSGMTNFGIVGIDSIINPRNANLTEKPVWFSKISLNETESNDKGVKNSIIQKNDESFGFQKNYSLMVRSSVLEKNQLLVSLIYPVIIELDDTSFLDTRSSQNYAAENFIDNNSEDSSTQNTNKEHLINPEILRNILRTVSLPIAIGLIIVIIYLKIKEKRIKSKDK